LLYQLSYSGRTPMIAHRPTPTSAARETATYGQ
jgi:hypothetical protein